MLRRVLKSKRADRVLWVVLFVLTLIGVGVALKLSLDAERRNRWVGGAAPDSELEENPLAANNRQAESVAPVPPIAPVESTHVPAPKPPAPKPPAPKPAAPKQAGPPKRQPAAPKPSPAEQPPPVAQLLMTPVQLKLAALTPACRNVIDRRGPWSDERTGKPWPECQDSAGRPMVVQFCTYAQLASGEWVLTENSTKVPRCEAELPDVRSGKLRPVKSQ